jgi:predicted acyl esterase
MRGSGDSEGVLRGEYLQQEQDDALEVLAWIAAQPWCTGSIGMIGISWGGFNGLQVAARRPAELKAVISLCSPTTAMPTISTSWAARCLSTSSPGAPPCSPSMHAPPGPGARRRQMARNVDGRLEGSGFWLEEWHQRQRRDEFYKHGSIAEDTPRSSDPVYPRRRLGRRLHEPIFRMLEKLQVPAKGLVGPWAQ